MVDVSTADQLRTNICIISNKKSASSENRDLGFELPFEQIYL